MNFKKGLSRHWLSTGWGLMILILTGIPGQIIPEVPQFMDMFAPDKIVHLVIFGVFVITIIRGLILEPGFDLARSAKVALMIALSMGAATEIMQRLVFINRQGSVWDFIVDAAGAFLGAWICKRWRNNFLKM